MSSNRDSIYAQLKIRVFIEIGPHADIASNQISTRHSAESYHKAYDEVQATISEYFGTEIPISKEESDRLGAFETVIVANGIVHVVHSKIKTRRFPSPTGLVNRFRVLLGEDIRSLDPSKWQKEIASYKAGEIPGLKYTWEGRDFMQPSLAKEQVALQHVAQNDQSSMHHRHSFYSQAVTKEVAIDRERFPQGSTVSGIENNCMPILIVPFSAYNGEVLNLHMKPDRYHSIIGASVTSAKNLKQLCCNVITLHGSWEFPVHAIRVSVSYFSTIMVSLQEAMGATWVQVNPTPTQHIKVDTHGPLIIPVFFARKQPVRICLHNSLGYHVPYLKATLTRNISLPYYTNYVEDENVCTNDSGEIPLESVSGTVLDVSLVNQRGYQDFQTSFKVPVSTRWESTRSITGPALSIIAAKTQDGVQSPVQNEQSKCNSETVSFATRDMYLMNRWMSNEGDGSGLDNEGELLKQQLKKQEEEENRHQQEEESQRRSTRKLHEHQQGTQAVRIECSILPLPTPQEVGGPSILINFSVTGLLPRYRWCTLHCRTLAAGLPLTQAAETASNVSSNISAMTRVAAKCTTFEGDEDHHNFTIRSFVGNATQCGTGFIFTLADQALIQWSGVEVCRPSTVPASRHVRRRKAEGWYSARLVGRTITGEFDCHILVGDEEQQQQSGRQRKNSASQTFESGSVVRVPRTCIRPVPVISLTRVWNKLQDSLTRSGAFVFPRNSSVITVRNPNGRNMEKSSFFLYGESLDASDPAVVNNAIGLATSGSICEHNKTRECFKLAGSGISQPVHSNEPLAYSRTTNTIHSSEQLSRGVLGEMMTSSNVVSVEATPIASGLVIPCFGNNLDGTNGNLAVYVFLEQGATFRVGGGNYMSSSPTQTDEDISSPEESGSTGSEEYSQNGNNEPKEIRHSPYDESRFVQECLKRVLAHENGWLSLINIDTVAVCVLEYAQWHGSCEIPLSRIQALNLNCGNPNGTHKGNQNTTSSGSHLLESDVWGNLPVPSGFARLYLPVGGEVDCTLGPPPTNGIPRDPEVQNTLELTENLKVNNDSSFGCEKQLIDPHLEDAMKQLEKNYDEEQSYHTAATYVQSSWKRHVNNRAFAQSKLSELDHLSSRDNHTNKPENNGGELKKVSERPVSSPKSTRSNSPVSASARMIPRHGSFLNLIENDPQQQQNLIDEESTPPTTVSAQPSVQSDAYDDDDFSDAFETSQDEEQQQDCSSFGDLSLPPTISEGDVAEADLDSASQPSISSPGTINTKVDVVTTNVAVPNQSCMKGTSPKSRFGQNAMVRFASKEDVRVFTRSKEEQEFHEAPVPEPTEDDWDWTEEDEHGTLSSMAESSSPTKGIDGDDGMHEGYKQTAKESKKKKKKKSSQSKKKSKKKRSKEKSKSKSTSLKSQDGMGLEHESLFSRPDEAKRCDDNDDDLDIHKPKAMTASLDGAMSLVKSATKSKPNKQSTRDSTLMDDINKSINDSSDDNEAGSKYPRVSSKRHGKKSDFDLGISSDDSQDELFGMRRHDSSRTSTRFSSQTSSKPINKEVKRDNGGSSKYDNLSPNYRSKARQRDDDDGNMSPSYRSKAKHRGDDDGNMSPSYRSKAKHRGDDDGNMSPSYRSKAKHRGDDDGNMSPSYRSKAKHRGDDDGNMSPSYRSKAKHRGDDDGNMSPSYRSKAKHRGDDDGNMSPSYRSKAKHRGDDDGNMSPSYRSKAVYGMKGDGSESEESEGFSPKHNSNSDSMRIDTTIDDKPNKHGLTSIPSSIMGDLSHQQNLSRPNTSSGISRNRQYTDSQPDRSRPSSGSGGLATLSDARMGNPRDTSRYTESQMELPKRSREHNSRSTSHNVDPMASRASKYLSSGSGSGIGSWRDALSSR